MGKRFFDLLCAVIGLVLLSPLFLSIALLIRLHSGPPVFYRGYRSGQHGKPFRIFKFRTMVVNAEKIGGPSTALNDSRLTKVGRFLRKYKFDELPQLINILKGEMSFVGPRPQVEEYTRRYSDEEKSILEAKPGLTDFASIKFINLDQILGDEQVDEKYLREIEPEKNRLRIKYVKEQSFATDMKILFNTFLSMSKLRSRWNTENWG